ncbi:hypothetical protein [Acidipila sp. EB88]|uniref:hypothetical protein n=1 Tax=Acidipila sp. EB88 TaxID=2305226 RepID=UPI000F5F3C77|nr:hypothetical protein [Acidipila sp. EB88]RRA48541.1 hypothetical protein D1Y84_09815 [Acidipila sp. EB88]
MSIDLQTSTGNALVESAREAGLTPAGVVAGTDFHGKPTARLSFQAADAAGQEFSVAPLYLELSDGFDPAAGNLRAGLNRHLHDVARRLRTAQPETYVTMSGLPLRFTGFQWPFHRSTSGADTLIVHGVTWLADGTGSPLHAKISASMTVTFAEIVDALEQPYAEDFIYNAIRKTFDYSQLELLKSGNRQPVAVTTRYYSRWQKKFLFTDTSEEQRLEFLTRKAFWLSAAIGPNAPVWLADPRDAQYLNTTEEQLQQDAAKLQQAGLVSLADGSGFAVATAALAAREPEYRAALEVALNSIKPAFNESMRGGHTNM